MTDPGSGSVKDQFKLEVPLFSRHNICMLDKEDKFLLIQDVEQSMSDLFWEYRDSVSDDGSKELHKELDQLRNRLINILEKYPA